MDHDRLFKDLLTTFFAEFIELFFPKMAAELGRDSIQFLDKEIFPDLNTGDRHEVDLLVKVKLSGREAFILIHVENQSTWQADFPKRMFRYFSLLHAKFDLPIFPIALFSFDRPLKTASDRYEIELFEKPILRFQFQTIQLNRLNWRDFINQPNPVASALMAKMNIAPADRPRVKVECLRMIATLKLNAARSSAIWVFMRFYLVLTPSEEIVYNTEIDAIAQLDEKETIMNYLSEWGAKARVDLLLKQLVYRFGHLPLEIKNTLEQLPDDKIDELAQALFDFKNLEDFQVWVAKTHLT